MVSPLAALLIFSTFLHTHWIPTPKPKIPQVTVLLFPYLFGSVSLPEMLRPSNKLSFQVSGFANCTDSGPQTICCPAVASRNYVIASATLHWHDPSVYTDLSLSETVTALIQHASPTISFLFLYMEIRKQDAFQNSKLISLGLAQGLQQRLQLGTFLSDLWQEVVHHRPLLWAGGRPNGCEKHSIRVT